MLDSTEKEVLTTSPQESSQDTQTVSGNRPDINEIADLSAENVAKAFANLGDPVVTAATIMTIDASRRNLDIPWKELN